MTTPLRTLRVLRFAVAVLVGFPICAHAQKVVILAAEEPAAVEDVRAKLVATGKLAVVDVVDVRAEGTPLPTLATLLNYDAVLTWSDYPYGDRTGIGDVLAAYVDQGHGVVQATFAFDPDETAALSPAGRWGDWGYHPFTLGSADIGTLSLVPDLPLHPILEGVAGVTTGPFGFFHAGVHSDACSTVVAHWSNGEPLVAVRRGPQGGRVVGLNLYPPSSDVVAEYWQASSDGARLMANALAFAASPAPGAAGPRIALVAADEASWVEDVRCKLEKLGDFGEVDRFDARTTTPSLDTLLSYDAVLTWSDANYGASATLGDRLADYADQGRGVVEALFAFSPVMEQRLEGRWRSAGYRAFGVGSAALATRLTLTPDLPGHPILEGVSGFDGGASSFHSAGMVPAAGTTLVASWSDGEPLVGTRTMPGTGEIVGLNLFPPSSDARSDLWDRTSDGARLIGNALLFAASGSPTPVNQAPSANAGADQTIEATSAAGGTFTLSAMGSDPDGDPLSFAWSGAISGSGVTLTRTLPPAAAPYIITLTVSDGRGGEATDTVAVTVRDTTGPVLSSLPGPVVAATATSPAGTAVKYGPVSAVDAVDGVRPVTCAPAGVFPIGDTTVTCSAADTRGNVATASFIVRVTTAKTPGFMVGNGFLRQGDALYTFQFAVREAAFGRDGGWLSLRVRTGVGRRQHESRFLARTADFIAFSDDPTVRPGRSQKPQVDTVIFSGTGEWNGVRGYRYEVVAVDQGGPGRHRESVRITISSSAGAVMARVDGVIGGGCVQSLRIPHR